MLDFDEFKQINDTHGHMIGDEVMKAIADRCVRLVRNIDLVGRFGGDEFIILLVETTAKDASRVAARICSSVAAMSIETEVGSLKMTVSIGVAPLYDGCPSLIDLINRADKALYAAKKAGKNRGVLLES